MNNDGSGYGYDAGGNHTGNAGILKALQSNSTFTGNNPAGSCELGSYSSYCNVGNLRLYACSNGNVVVDNNDTNANCNVTNIGYPYCRKYQHTFDIKYNI